MKMDVLGSKDARFVIADDLLNFNLEDGGMEEGPIIFKGAPASSSSALESSNPSAVMAALSRGTQNGSFPEFVEEELEWLSNKDAFPSVETCFGILSDNPELMLNQQSPVSVLENSHSSSSGSAIASCCDSLKVPTRYPVRARTKSRRSRRVGSGYLPSQHCSWQQELTLSFPPLPSISNGGAAIGRRCLHCQADKTPQWRAGPMGPKTLCNACGVRYKSGRLLPEYRPASSPTFSVRLHSNSHRKVIEMRKQKQVAGGEATTANVACGYRLG